jgi:hypothetical protein
MRWQSYECDGGGRIDWGASAAALEAVRGLRAAGDKVSGETVAPVAMV